uniref:Uncharacterized protein n=1 Tax=viral metagenome TaxID=1070528 RepID=A0A6C0LVP5_9ZZZZ
MEKRNTLKKKYMEKEIHGKRNTWKKKYMEKETRRSV